MNARQIDKAARLYLLAMCANMDDGGAETSDHADVSFRAREIACARLEKMGYHRSELTSIDGCIEAAKEQPHDR